MDDVLTLSRFANAPDDCPLQMDNMLLDHFDDGRTQYRKVRLISVCA